MYKNIDMLEIDSINIDNNLIDIREKYECMLGVIPRSINIPYNYLLVNPDNYLMKEKTYYLYCQTGSRSKKLCSILNASGYNTIDLMGGYDKYIKKTSIY